MSITFSARKVSNTVDDYRCNETGVHYQIERTRDGYVVLNSGNVVAHRTERQMCVTYIEQQAELDFRTAQADSAFANDNGAWPCGSC
jgi:hypothetical protein